MLSQHIPTFRSCRIEVPSQCYSQVPLRLFMQVQFKAAGHISFMTHVPEYSTSLAGIITRMATLIVKNAMFHSLLKLLGTRSTDSVRI